MMRDHSAIAKKAARTRATLKSARNTDRPAYDKARRDSAVKEQVRKLIAIQCGYQDAGYHDFPYQWGSAAGDLRAGAPLRKNRPARRAT